MAICYIGIKKHGKIIKIIQSLIVRAINSKFIPVCILILK
jgi:hypothetical protein